MKKNKPTRRRNKRLELARREKEASFTPWARLPASVQQQIFSHCDYKAWEAFLRTSKSARTPLTTNASWLRDYITAGDRYVVNNNSSIGRQLQNIRQYQSDMQKLPPAVESTIRQEIDKSNDYMDGVIKIRKKANLPPRVIAKNKGQTRLFKFLHYAASILLLLITLVSGIFFILARDFNSWGCYVFFPSSILGCCSVCGTYQVRNCIASALSTEVLGAQQQPLHALIAELAPATHITRVEGYLRHRSQLFQAYEKLQGGLPPLFLSREITEFLLMSYLATPHLNDRQASIGRMIDNDLSMFRKKGFGFEKLPLSFYKTVEIYEERRAKENGSITIVVENESLNDAKSPVGEKSNSNRPA